MRVGLVTDPYNPASFPMPPAGISCDLVDSRLLAIDEALAYFQIKYNNMALLVPPANNPYTFAVSDLQSKKTAYLAAVQTCGLQPGPGEPGGEPATDNTKKYLVIAAVAALVIFRDKIFPKNKKLA